MTTFGQQPSQFDLPADQPTGTNTLGIVGFILSFCLSPIGLIVSLIALGKSPRGFAIGGVVIGLVGSVLWVVFGLTGVAMYRYGKDVFATISEIATIRTSIENYKKLNGTLPPDLATAGISGDSLTDIWGTPYDYVPGTDGASWTLTILGADKTKGTSDDAVITSTMSDRDLQDALRPMIEASVREKIEQNAQGGSSGATTPAPADTTPTDPAPADTKPADPTPAPAGG